MHIRALLVACLVLGPMSPSSDAQTPLPLNIERVSERVLVMSPRTGNSRVVVLNTRAGLVMLNTGWSPAITRRLKSEAERAFGRTDWYGVIVTSEEFLGNGGIGVFPGATVIAQEGFREYLLAHRDDMDGILAARRSEFQDRVTRTRGMLDTLQADPVRRHGLETWLELCRTIADDLEGGFTIPLPGRTFSDRLSLDLGDLTVECISFGGTPEQGCVMVRIPEENLIWLGDVFHAAHVLPYGEYTDAPPDVDGWLAVLDELLSGERETMKVFRANGEDAWTWRQVSDRRRLIADIRNAVQDARRRGESLEALLSRLADVETAFPYVRDWSSTMLELIRDDVRRTVEGLWRFEVSASSGSFTDARL
jgi:glyoxylase-like metal-dependent hydrolase (beta-lactamase superfamily II)